MVVEYLGEDPKAGGCFDAAGNDALAQMLQWLRRWRRKDLAREVNPVKGVTGEAKAGGYGEDVVMVRWVEAWWISLLPGFEDSDDEESNERRAGGRRKRNATEVAAAVARPLPFWTSRYDSVRPFDGRVDFLVEEWLEDHMTGDKAPATEKAWEKWCCYARRQGWPSEYLTPSDGAISNETKVLNFLGYLGWLGASANTLRQHLFAIKNAHKRAGCGDPTDKMHRIWILTNAMDRESPQAPGALV